MRADFCGSPPRHEGDDLESGSKAGAGGALQTPSETVPSASVCITSKSNLRYAWDHLATPFGSPVLPGQQL